MKTRYNSGAFRYSNANVVGEGVFQEIPGSNDYSSINGGGDWTAQNTVDVVNTGAGLIQSVLTAIFGRNNVQQAQYTNELYKQEQRTNTILWVVLGLVLALGVFLVIRKTK